MALQPRTPGINSMSGFLVTAAPGINVLDYLAQDVHRGEVTPLKDQVVPGFPDVPENQEDHVDMDHKGKCGGHHNCPGFPERGTWDGDAETSPKRQGNRAACEYVIVGFKHAMTSGAPGLIEGFDVPVMEMGTSVQPSMVEKPREELDLGGKTGCPESDRVTGGSRSFKNPIGTPGCERLDTSGREVAGVRAVMKSDSSEAIREEEQFCFSGMSEPRPQGFRQARSQHLTDGAGIVNAVGEKSREGSGNGVGQEPTIVPGGKLTVAKLNSRQRAIAWQFISNQVPKISARHARGG